MNTNNKSDQNINHDEFWDDELMWENIEKELDKKDKDKLGLWLFFGIGCFLVVSFSLLYFTNDGIDQVSENVISTESVNFQKTERNDEVTERDAIERGNAELKLDEPTNIQSRQNENEINARAVGTSNIRNRQNETTRLTMRDKSVQEERKQNQTLNSLLSKKNSESTDEVYSNRGVNQDNDSDQRSIYAMMAELKSIASNSRKNNVISTYNSERVFGIDVQPVDPYVNLKDSYPTSLLFYTSLGDLSMDNEYDSTVDWMSAKELSEESLYYFDLGIQYNKPVYKSLFVSLGAEYSNNTYRVITTDTAIIDQQLVQSDTAVIVDGVTPLYLSGQRTRTLTEITDYEVYNKLERISLPISIGVKKDFGKNGLMLSIGTRLDIYNGTRGYTILPDGRVGAYSALSDRITKSRINSMNISALYTITLSDHWGLACGIYWNRAIGRDYKITDSESNHFERNTQNVALRLGLTYSF